MMASETFSEAEIRRGYADVGIRNENSEFHFNFTGADNKVGVTSAAPEALLDNQQRTDVHLAANN